MRHARVFLAIGLWLTIADQPGEPLAAGTRPFHRPPASLQGIRRGQTFALRHPHTGALDSAATVRRLEETPYSGVAVALVEFSDGLKTRFAVERLRLVGQPLAEQRRALALIKRSTAAAIQAELGLDASQVPLTSMSDRALLKLRGREVAGFHDEGKVYLSRAITLFDPRARTHEVLHALSRPFYEQASLRDRQTAHPLTEAVTEVFAHRVAIKRLGYRAPDPTHPYYNYLRFGLRIAELLGMERLEQLFFTHDRQGTMAALAASVDGTLGRPGSFDAALSALAQQRGEEALVSLGGPPRTTNPWR